MHVTMKMLMPMPPTEVVQMTLPMPPAMKARTHTASVRQELPSAVSAIWLKKVISRRGKPELQEKRQHRNCRRTRLLFLNTFSLLAYGCLRTLR
jgi:hypothetical protein